MTLTLQPARQAGTADLRKRVLTGLRSLAGQVDEDMPAMHTGNHMRDAARAVEHGNLQGAKRHLEAAMATLTPQSLYRHGVTDDAGHNAAKMHMSGINRHHLLIHDLDDAHQHNAEARNISNITRMGHETSSPQGLQPPQPQLGGPRIGPSAMNAPRTTPGNAPDRSVAAPNAPQRRGSKQFAGHNIGDQIELVGPRGYVHGWKFVGVPGESFTYHGKPGSFDHARAIRDVGEKFLPTGELATGPNTFSPHAEIISTALGHAAEAMVRRDMAAANVHMDMAIRSGRRMGPSQAALLRQVKESLKAVPGFALLPHDENTRPGGNPLSPRELQRHRSSGRPGYYPELVGKSNPNPLAIYTGLATELSAQTGALAVTPAPRGKPGGPGLYDVKGLSHSPYFQQVVKALIEKRGMPPGKAYAIAWGALRRWRAGGGKVHPEVRAAASGALAQEDAARARAHSHTSWDELAEEITLAAGGPQWQNETRVQKGQPGGGQFGAGGQGKPGAGKPGHKPKPGESKAQRKKELLHQVASDRVQLASLKNQLAAYSAMLPSNKPRSTAPRKATNTPRKSASAAASSAAASARSSARNASKTMSTAQIQGKVNALRAQITALRSQIKADLLQAAKL